MYRALIVHNWARWQSLNPHNFTNNDQKGYFDGNYSVLYYVACPVYCSSAVLSRLLDTIAIISNDKLISMIICPITEGFEWPGYNLIIKSKGKGPRFIGQIV